MPEMLNSESVGREGRARMRADHVTDRRPAASLVERREGAVDEETRADRAQVTGRAEGNGGVDALGGAVDPAALRAVEGHLLAVHGEEVLAEELAEVLEQVAEPADDRVVAADRVRGLPCGR